MTPWDILWDSLPTNIMDFTKFYVFVNRILKYTKFLIILLLV